jgi:hypothetical protein
MLHTKRACKRGTVSARTVANVPTDTWLLICANAYRSPHAVFRLMMASKGVRDALRAQSRAWWLAFFRSICEYQASLQHSNTLKTLRLYARSSQATTECILRAIFIARCQVCGCTKGHALLRPYALRVCGGCLRQNLISNVALEREYGIHFCDWVERYVRELNAPLLALDGFIPRQVAMQHLTTETIPASLLRRNSVFFLWRPALARLVNLDQAHANFAAKRQAHAFLVPIFQRLARRTLRYVLPTRRHPLWIPGGPVHALTGRLRMPQRNARRVMAMLKKQAQTGARSVRWFPRLPPPVVNVFKN